MADIKKDDNAHSPHATTPAGGSPSGTYSSNPSSREGVYGSQSGSQSGGSSSAGRSGGSSSDAMSRAYEESRHRGEELAGEARRRGEDYMREGRRWADEARERGERYYEEALHRGRDYYDEAMHRGHDYYDEAYRYGSEGYAATRDFVRENPLLIGVLGLAAGLAIGALLPRSRHEDETIGRYADDLRHQGMGYAREAVRAGRDYAHEAFARTEEGHPTHESEWRRDKSEEEDAARRSGPLDTQRRH